MKEEEEEREIFEVRLQKDEQGLGLTVAGYICEKGKTLNRVSAKIGMKKGFMGFDPPPKSRARRCHNLL